MARGDENGWGNPPQRDDSAKGEEGRDLTGALVPEPRSEEVSISPFGQVPPSGSFSEVSARDVEAQNEDREPENQTRRIRSSDGDDLAPGAPPPDPRLGLTLVGRYKIEKLIGKGGMGRVYLATQLPLGRPVAVKILSPEFQRKDPQFVRRFFLEAATAARLNHPNSITIYDYGETERGELFIAMEFLKGRPLSRVLAAEGAFSAERALHVTVQMVRALREAHAKGIIHRDLKPGNIMLLDEGDDADFAKVLDFGLVKLFNAPGVERQRFEELGPEAEVGELTRAGMFLGSPKYMSPEQIQGRDLDPRTDIYSLGIIMFQMLAGRVPFRGASSVEIIYKHVNEAVPPIHELNPEADCPPELEVLISKTLSKDREQRYASMGDLLSALKDVRRLLLGNSSASGNPLGLDFVSQYPLRDSGQLSPEMPAGIGASGSLPPGSSRPREVRGAGARESGGAPAAASRPPGGVHAAPFQEASLARDESGELSSQLRYRSLGRKRQGSSGRLLPWAGVALVLGALGGGAFMLSSSERTTVASTEPGPVPALPPAAAPDPLPIKREALVRFQSRPDGARVLADGDLIGVTPFELRMARSADQPEAKTFTFQKDGYFEEHVSARIDSETVKIATFLRQMPQEPPEPDLVSPPAKKRDKDRRSSTRRASPSGTTEYKENPY